MTSFITEAALAEALGASEAQVTEWRRRYNWPHVKIGRQVRFTEADVRAIESLHHVTPKADDVLPGQTALSAARSR